MSTKLFVAGLAYSLTNDELSQHFGQFGQVVSAQIIIDRMTGRSKGFGFVEMSSEEEAKAAMEGLNETEFAGRKIIVNEARPQEARPNNYSQRDNRGGGGGRDRDRRGGRDDRRSKSW